MAREQFITLTHPEGHTFALSVNKILLMWESTGGSQFTMDTPLDDPYRTIFVRETPSQIHAKINGMAYLGR